MGISLVSLSVALTSLGYVTYSWFIFNKKASVSLDVSVEKDISYEFKYFIANGEYGYEADAISALGDYSQSFLPVSNDFHQLNMPLLHPGLRRTFALELSLESTSASRNYEIYLDDFTSSVAANYYNLATQQNISMAEAINIYGKSYLTNNIASTNKDSANSYLTDSGLNLFDKDLESSLLSSISYSASENSQMIIFFFTLEFSDDSSTYYNYHSRIGDDLYYEKTSIGNSNVYQNLTFTIDSLLIKRVY